MLHPYRVALPFPPKDYPVLNRLALPLTACFLLVLGVGFMLTGLFHVRSVSGIVLMFGGFISGSCSLLLLMVAGRERLG